MELWPTTTPWDGMPEGPRSRIEPLVAGTDFALAPLPPPPPWWRRIFATAWAVVLKYMGAPE